MSLCINPPRWSFFKILKTHSHGNLPLNMSSGLSFCSSKFDLFFTWLSLSYLMNYHLTLLHVTWLHTTVEWSCFAAHKSMCKTAVFPLLTHWRYCSFALSHQNDKVKPTLFGSVNFGCLLVWSSLIHLPLEKMAAISQTIFSYAFSWMKSFVYSIKFLWNLSLRVQLTTTQHWNS